MHEAGRLSRLDLVNRTGLSRATVAALVAELVADGVVREDEAGPGTTRAGRPPQTLTIVNSVAYAIGADIGHRHVRVVLSDAGGSLLWDERVALDTDLAPHDTLSSTARLITEALEDTGVPRDHVIGVGLGIASPVYYGQDGLAAEGIMPGWVGIHPGNELAKRTGIATTLINDANAGAIGEHLYGAGRLIDNMIFVRLAEGVGAGIISGGRILVGTRGLAGEIGHLPAVHDGLICRCGNRGCLETVATPSALLRLLSASRHETMTVEALIDLLAAGDRGTRLAVEDVGQAVGRALASMVTLFDPELIVVGGDLARAGEIMLDPIRRTITRHAMPSTSAGVRVVASELLDSAEVRGAAGVILGQVPQALTERGSRRLPAVPK